MIRRLSILALLASALLLAPAASLAQSADGGDEDAGSIDPPDGSVGEGGADRDNPEGDDSVGRVPTTCTETVDCAPGFRCENGRCNYLGIRDAEGGFFGSGCSASGADALLPALAGLLLARRRCRSRSR